MSLSSHLQTVLRKLEIYDKDQEKYISHAVIISDNLMIGLQNVLNCSSFCGPLKLTTSIRDSNFDGVKLKTLDEFDMQIKFKSPFRVVPDGFGTMSLYSRSTIVSNKKIQVQLCAAFRKVLRSYNMMCVCGENYYLVYEQPKYGYTHTILATSKVKMISFDFVPVFEYSYDKWPFSQPPGSADIRTNWSWFAVPQSEETFMVCAPHWEREMLKGKDNLKSVLRLMKSMRDAHKDDLPHLSSYMLKTVILLELEGTSTNFWQQDLATIYMAMWSKLVQYLQNGHLPFFLAKDCNQFVHFDKCEYQKCKHAAEALLDQFKSLGRFPCYQDVAENFLKYTI